MIYSLRSENLTNLGGPMGSEYTYDNYVKYFTSAEKAKHHAELEYGHKLTWIKEAKNRWRTGDLGRVMYHVEMIEIVK